MKIVKNARLLATIILVVVGVIYLALSAFLVGLEIPAVALLLVGLLYLAIGAGLFREKRFFYYSVVDCGDFAQNSVLRDPALWYGFFVRD